MAGELRNILCETVSVCGRYASFRQAQELADIFSVDLLTPLAAELPPSWNLAPTQIARIVREELPGGGTVLPGGGADAVRLLDVAKWGLVPSWAQDESIGSRMINARAETLFEKPSFKGPAIYSRCVVPVEGYFEWQAVPGRKTKVPHFIYRADGEPLALAGMTALWRGELLTFTVATRAARGSLLELHDREPAMLADQNIDAWLDPGLQDRAAIAGLLREPGPPIAFHAVSTMVNTPRNNTPDLVEAVQVGLAGAGAGAAAEDAGDAPAELF